MKNRSSSTRQRVGVISLALVSTVLTCGCQRYPEVTSRESLNFIKLLYTACNTRSVDRLANCERTLASLSRDGKIGESERAAFQEIIDTARNGDWQTAQYEALKFAEEQVR